MGAYFECDDKDYSGSFQGAMHHAGLTGHTLVKEKFDGTTITISLNDEEEED